MKNLLKKMLRRMMKNKKTTEDLLVYLNKTIKWKVVLMRLSISILNKLSFLTATLLKRLEANTVC